MSETAITPAITNAGWTVFINWAPKGPYAVTGSARNCGSMGCSNRHELAAMALYEQPFGFTHEDVSVLQSLAEPIEVHDERDVGQNSHELIDFETFPLGTKSRLVSLIARIAALLPAPTWTDVKALANVTTDSLSTETLPVDTSCKTIRENIQRMWSAIDETNDLNRTQP